MKKTLSLSIAVLALTCTTLFGAQAMVNAIESLKREKFGVRSLQEYHASKSKLPTEELAAV